MTELLQAQLGDVFRIGLIIGLIITAARTKAVTGTALPLAAGVLVIAAIIPLTTASSVAAPFWMQVLSGVIANVILLAIGLGIWKGVESVRR